jgi:hypothetical protein
MERIVFDVCPRVFEGSLNFADSKVWRDFDLKLGPPDKDGNREVLRGSGYSIHLGANHTGQVCHVKYVGPNSAALYEQALERLRNRDFVFVNGERAAPEKEFLMDTLATESGPVAIVTMFRIHVVPPTSFIMTAMASGSGGVPSAEGIQ